MVVETHKRLGAGNGYGYGNGYGNGAGNGHGYGHGYGYGTGNGYGNGNGNGSALLCTGPDLSDVQATVLGVVFESMVVEMASPQIQRDRRTARGRSSSNT